MQGSGVSDGDADQQGEFFEPDETLHSDGTQQPTVPPVQLRSVTNWGSLFKKARRVRFKRRCWGLMGDWLKQYAGLNWKR